MSRFCRSTALVQTWFKLLRKLFPCCGTEGCALAGQSTQQPRRLTELNSLFLTESLVDFVYVSRWTVDVHDSSDLTTPVEQGRKRAWTEKSWSLRRPSRWDMSTNQFVFAPHRPSPPSVQEKYSQTRDKQKVGLTATSSVCVTGSCLLQNAGKLPTKVSRRRRHHKLSHSSCSHVAPETHSGETKFATAPLLEHQKYSLPPPLLDAPILFCARAHSPPSYSCFTI